MPEQQSEAASQPLGGLGDEGEPFDLTVLAPETDAEIAQGVRAAFQLDPDVAASHFAVAVTDGRVTLTPQGATAAEQQRAVELARVVHGVQDVTLAPTH